MADLVHRITLFKLPDKTNQHKLIQAYKTVDQTNQKDGKPYIVSLNVGPTEEDARSQGYTVACKAEFASLDDMKYYDEKCQAHQALKDIVKGLGVEGVLTVYFKPQVTGGLSP
ncbi:hypothetical protein E4U21_006453 [Claviceps maximensis]|nr:hypothetical protein E4U21_006453 [Claviceps maximensis]